MFPKLPHPACHCCTPLQERKHRSRECGRGFPRALMRSASLTHPRGRRMLGFLLLASVSLGRDPVPLGVELGQNSRNTRGGSQRGAAQLAPSQLCSLVATLQGLCFPSFCKGAGGQEQPVEERSCEGSLQPGKHVGAVVQSTLVTLQNGGGPGTSVSSLAAVPSEDLFPGHVYGAQDV